MIPANELRIGNWVLSQSNKLIKDISTTTQIRVVTKQEEHKWMPIPLTPEIILAVGGKQQIGSTKSIGEYEYWELGEYEINRVYEGAFAIEGIEGATIKTLHHLQNIYFAISGKELEYKPK